MESLQNQKEALLLHYKKFQETFQDLPAGTMKRVDQAYREKLIDLDMAIAKPSVVPKGLPTHDGVCTMYQPET